MFRKIFLPILGIVGSLVFLFFSLTVLPFLMGGLATICVIGCILGALASIFALVIHCIRGGSLTSTRWYKAIKWSFSSTGLGLFVLAFLIWGCILLSNYCASQFNHTTSNPVVTSQTVVTNDSEVETTTSTAVNNSAAIPAVNPGLDQPSKSWFLAKAGTLISGDIAIFDNDNNSKKIPVYDSKEGTADIIYLNQDTYIWAEWGCYTIDNANTQDIATLINNKLDANFTSVRYFNGYNKLGTNTPAIISSHIDASSIALPSLTTKK